MDEPAGDDLPIGFDPQHVRTFLTRIREDRDRELADIRNRVEAETRRIRKEGYQAARRLASEVAADTRERQRREHDRFLYKTRSELTRARWSILGELRAKALQAVRSRFEQAWLDEARQWAWCRHWVETACTLAAGAPLEVHLGGAGSPVAQRIEELLQSYAGEWVVHLDAEGPTGVLVSWPDHRLDGTLASHVAYAAEEVMERVVGLLNPTAEPDESDEPG